MPRWLTPVVLAAVAVSATVAVGPGRPAAAPAPVSSLTVPVLSPRRVPGVLSRVIADLRLRSQLDAAVSDPVLGGARQRSCLLVSHGARRLYERRPDEPLIPASGLKLLTAAAALFRLGGESRIVTEARAGGPLTAGVLAGPLWLVGAGDPVLGTADYAATFRNQPHLFTPLEHLADRVVERGVREVRGGVAGDERRYDTQRYVPTWKPSYVTHNEIGPISALSVNDGFAEFTATKRVATPAPARHAAEVLTKLLRARGVVVAGSPSQGAAPPHAPVLAAVESAPLREIVADMVRESDNLSAEVLTKELGRRASGHGTTAAGVAALRGTLGAAGLPVAGLVAVDGSGLDRSDRATCALLHAVIDRAGPASDLASGLPVAGGTGTLAERFRSHPAAGRMRAKTGSLDGVAGLTGYMDPAPGARPAPPLAFALLANDLPRESVGRALQESVAAVLARYPDAPPPEALTP